MAYVQSHERQISSSAVAVGVEVGSEKVDDD